MFAYEPFWGMHFFWWIFWIFAMIAYFGYNIPLRANILGVDPQAILRRRFAEAELSEKEYHRLKKLLRRDEESAFQDLSQYASKRKVIGNAFLEGLSLSATWSVIYSLFSIFYWISPQITTSAAARLFSGFLYSRPMALHHDFSFGDFATVLSIGAVFTFLIGVFWSLIHTSFIRKRNLRSFQRYSKTAFKTN